MSPDQKTSPSMENQETHSSDESPETSFTTLSEHDSPKDSSSQMKSLVGLSNLYTENVIAKLWRVATAHDQNA